ncbi:uncharacterized protein Dana_GF13900, isoform A [Drosophila ananassae]|uniref:Uncharacterized protein, isoform A n=1 Tax=Drosophila ananassae TaxID=7217 RepID=B3N1C5_DROAN|nr:uncharacterized protein LOC6496735 isoform X2 [Drosophila ananassae]EDV33646.2 uncharacterized protein Dana_GF13900, isoform A [Drosophila ananassae]
MEHLDLAVYHANTSKSWNCLGSFEQQDGACLSNSRQILEPIIEETSEDEENSQGGWNAYQEQRNSFWSSTESETGSVIRIEIPKDIDAMSERDFACPPKRAKRCQELDQVDGLDESVQLRHPLHPDPEPQTSLDRFLSLEPYSRDSYGSQGQRNSTGSRRGGVFEDYFSDNDSYHSLSRSSSLVQFESLERQLTLQEQHQSMSSLGNSSPSLISCEQGAGLATSDANPDSRRASASSLTLMKRYESSDGRLHQTYYELNKLTFEDQQERKLFSKNLHQAELKSDSESSSSSSDASGHSLITSCSGHGCVADGRKPDGVVTRRMPLTSAENLSEDSGYCEPSTLHRDASKSISQNFDKLCEEEEMQLLEDSSLTNQNSTVGDDLCQLKIEQPSGTNNMPCSQTLAINSSPERPTSSASSTSGSMRPSASASASESPSQLPSPSGSVASSAASFTWLHNSLPDIREPRGSSSPNTVLAYPELPTYVTGYVLATKSKRITSSSRSSSSSSAADFSPPLGTTHSLPNELQQLGRRRRSRNSRSHHRNARSNSSSASSGDEWEEAEERRDDFFDCHSLPKIRRSCSWNDRAGGISRRVERSRISVGVASAGYLNASYQNLTLLDYTDQQPTTEQLQKNHKRTKSANMSDRSSVSGGDYEQVICKGNFLLDEISKIYDKNVSILNDMPNTDKDTALSSDNKTTAEVLHNTEMLDSSIVCKLTGTEEDSQASIEAPQVQHVQLTIRKPPPRTKRMAGNLQTHSTSKVGCQPATLTFSSFGKTFDQVPTNLRTSYAQSLEQCNFDIQEVTASKPLVLPTPRSLPKRRFQSHAAGAKTRSLVSSTPDLSAYVDQLPDQDDDIYVSSAHTSMHQLPQTATQPKPLGILLPAGSRNSFSKEVSFCPVVSKYCWQEQSSEEPQEEHGNSSEGISSDDELLDNADATVVHNTKENENIAARYNQEQTPIYRSGEGESSREPPIAAEESDENNENIVASGSDPKCETKTNHEHELASDTAVTVNLEPLLCPPGLHLPARFAQSSLPPLHTTTPTPSYVPTPETSHRAVIRPLSLHLPILSEPPTNRAHHILYASQQLLQRYDTEDPEIVSGVGDMPPTSNPKQPAVAAGSAGDKHPSSKGFLSRFAHGLRLSLRRKKKQQQLDPTEQKQPPVAVKVVNVKQSQSNENGRGCRSSDSFIQIPLKPPRNVQSVSLENSVVSETSTVSLNSVRQPEQLAKTSTLQKVTGKPPLPKQPPRSGSLAHAPHGTAQGAVAVPSVASESEAMLEAERKQYQKFAKQLSAGVPVKMRDTESPSRATVAQKTQMFNQLGGNGRGVRPTVVTAVPVAVSPEDCAEKMGLIETNLDTHETIISGKTRSLMDITSNPLSLPHKRYIVKRLNVSSAAYEVDDLDGDAVKNAIAGGGVQIASVRRPHKSMEFLLDKENHKNALPPENELQKSHDQNPVALSEHQIRVQASLQRLNIPDWFRHYNQGDGASSDGTSVAGRTTTGGYRPGNFTRKRTQESSRWQGLNSKTTSLSSLGSQRSDRSPLLLSPSAHSHHGGQSSSTGGTSADDGSGHVQTGLGATRWSTSHLNSTQTSPIISQRGSFTRGAPITSSFISVASSSGVLRNSYRQPYLGWRSTEKLSQRTPHERLANSLLTQRVTPSPNSVTNGVPNQPPVTSEIQSSIKEVTSAIVHYVNDQQQQQKSEQQRSRSTSPNSRKCWLESSFVGIRPLHSPLTPMIDSSPPTSTHGNHQLHSFPYHLHLEDSLTPVVTTEQPSLRMNGLSRVGGGGASEPASRQQLQALAPVDQQKIRRRSEGDAAHSKKPPIQEEPYNHFHSHSLQGETNSQKNAYSRNRRVSLENSPPAEPDKESNDKLNGEPQPGIGLEVRCRNTKCLKSASPADAKKLYKSCHNCSYLYCTRECRRAHWEKHRKACLHSRASNLCRQVLATCKDDTDSQRQLSLLARKGSLSQGRGVVRVLFRSADAAECFIKNGFQCMGEASYVRWPDLMPAEMGLELYSELLKLSTEYKPESKMLIYVAICVVSEAPGMGQAPVRWERQLVSRCAKLKLCKSALAEMELQQQALQQSLSVVAVPERTEILILTFNPGQRTLLGNRELILSNILDILSRRGVILRKHYPEIFQRLQTFTEGQNDKFNPVTLHPRDSQTGQSFVCIIMPVHTDGELIKLPSAADGCNRVTTIDVGSPAALAQLDDDELLMRSSPAS